MTRKQDSAKKIDWKELIGEQEDFCGRSSVKCSRR
jgi:hypothetical protein